MNEAPEPIDVAALRAKYRQERDKRIRSDGNDQYLEVTGRYASFGEERLDEALVHRVPVVDDVDAVVVGGGYGGLLCAARLRGVGLGRVRVIEKGAQLGGTWYWNQYPGAQCDIESYIYMPLLEELGVMPSERYARAPEILAHTQKIAEHFDLTSDALVATEVTEMRWDDTEARWHVATNRGDAVTARYVVLATGPLHRPKLPGVDGIERFEGDSFHTSRWDYEITGGSSLGQLDKLAKRRVAIIGTGATAVQVVPHLAESAEHVYVFQRTPSSVDARNNALTDERWFAAQPSGWQRERMENFNAMLSGAPMADDLVNDGWTALVHEVIEAYRSGRSDVLGLELEQVVELVNLEHMERLRHRIDSEVVVGEVAESLKPYYGLFCKRPCFNDDYLASFNRDNVTLVDTAGHGIQAITERGVIANGHEYEVDLIVYATGFEVGTGFERRSGCAVIGRDGRTLTEKWAENGIRTLHGMHSHGYPNCFIVSQFQAGWTANYTHLLDEASRHLSFIVEHAEREGYSSVEATRQSEENWAEIIVANATTTTAGIGGTDCTPGYYNNEGAALDGPPYATFYGKGSIAFFELTRRWREAGTFDGLEFNVAVPVRR